MRAVVWMFLLAACASDSGTDEDEDGWTVEEGDCDDADASVYPGAPELSDTDGWDQNCDGPGE